MEHHDAQDKHSKRAKRHDGLLIVTWDESDARSPTNQIPLIIVGAGLKLGHSNRYVIAITAFCARWKISMDSSR
ncbi:MAG: hypothetical protein ACRESQ_01070 [Gammaproteobacteria bacterium]